MPQAITPAKETKPTTSDPHGPETKKTEQKQAKYKPPTELQQKIIETHQAHPTLNKSDIAAVVGCDHAHVVRTLQTYGMVKDRVDDYIGNRAIVLAGLQERIIKSITDEDIKKAPVGSRILAVAQLYDKERLETGKSTGNLAVVQFQMPTPDPVPEEYKVEGNVIDVTPATSSTA